MLPRKQYFSLVTSEKTLTVGSNKASGRRWSSKWRSVCGWVDFFKNYIFKISALSLEKWAIARFSSKTNKISNLCYFLAASEDKELKNGSCKSQNRKLSYSSFFSAWCTDFKNIIFEKIHSASSEVIEVKRSFSRSPRPDFGFHLVFLSFHLEFSSFWVSRLFDLGDLKSPVLLIKMHCRVRYLLDFDL